MNIFFPYHFYVLSLGTYKAERLSMSSVDFFSYCYLDLTGSLEMFGASS